MYRYLTLSLILLNALVNAFAITGISAGVNQVTGERPFRQEINAFAQSGAAWDLFVLAFRQLQQTSQNNTVSFYQIGGIHGYPQIPWDGVSGTQQTPGFCTHATVVFPTWHRPYVALIEQVLWSNAQAIARTYPLDQQDDYLAAAATLRIPYWDWATNPALPEVTTSWTLTINTPDGTQTVDNPLFNYTFHAHEGGNGLPSGDPMAAYPWTVRHYNQQLYQSNNSEATATMLANAPTILNLLYGLLTSVSDYTNFSCTKTPGEAPNPSNNLETIHNGIHNFVGGFGHMTYPEVAGFDPIFFLHHSNVDRILAMWQALYPDNWVEPGENLFGTYYEAPSFVDTSTSALAPFHSDNGTTLHTSDSVQSTRSFGYAYPEVVDWNVTNAIELAATVRAKVNALWNPSAGSSTNNVSSSRYVKRGVDVASGFNDVSAELTKQLGVNNLHMQWTISIQLQRFAYSTTFNIDFFMGKPPSDPAAWATARNLIGTHSQFIAANVSTIHPGNVPQGMLQGEISMTHTLAAGVFRGLLSDLSPASVVPLLAQSLTWRARGPDGCEIDVARLTDLSIAVGSRRVEPASSIYDFPSYEAMEFHAEATEGKSGGFNRTEECTDE